MAGETTRKQKSRQLMEHTINTVDRIFTEEGFQALTMQNISAKSGISVGSLQHHFTDKEGLLLQYGTEVFRQMLKCAPQADPMTDTVSAYISIIEPFRLYAAFCEIMGCEFISAVPARFSDDIFYNICWKDTVCPRIREAAAAGWLWVMPDDISKIEEDTAIICKGTVMLWSVSSDDLPDSLESLLTRILTKFLHEERIVDPPFDHQRKIWLGLEREQLLKKAAACGGLIALYREAFHE